MKKNAKTYSVNLFLKNKKCLVVGGGKVATRKVQGLLGTAVEIKVVAAKASKIIQELAEKAEITYLPRDFQKKDLNDIYLAFLATSDRKLNKDILQMCLEKNILCCAVDDNWKDGLFITPASVEKNGIKIAISTDGKSCRKTRLIKDNLAKHVEMVENAELLILGTDHNYLNLAEREKLHLIGNKFDQIAEMISHLWGIHEYMVINTCNRIEIAAIVSPNEQLERLLKNIIGFGALANDSYYIKYGLEAFGHMASVLAGLMSQTPGEKHITAQVKEALNIAREKEWAGSMIQEWMDSSLHISKHIRQKVEPFLKNFEIEDLSIQFIVSECKDLKKKKALILGSGVIGEIVCKQLVKKAKEVVWCYHQNKPKNIQVDNCRIISMKSLKDVLPDIDLIVCATTSESPVIHHGHAPFFDFSREVMVVDLSSPRNVSPELEKLMSNIQLTDLDDLKYWFRREAVDMAKIFEISNKLINEHEDLYQKIIYHFQG